MSIPTYLAMTSAELRACSHLPPKVGWMACHFSSGGNGLCNLPGSLPQDSLLILDDSTPYQNHGLDLILSHLRDAVAALKPKALLLDFQRPGNESVQALASILVRQLPCPVVVSSCYADALDCPIFLPPGPLWQPLTEYLKPHQGRTIWLDAAPICGQVSVTTEGSQYVVLGSDSFTGKHFDDALHCHYTAKVEENRIIFKFSRSCNDLRPWLQEAEQLGVSGAVGLYQEMNTFVLTNNDSMV